MGNVAIWEHKPMTLVDGTVVSNYSEEWRAQCEAFAVLNLADEKKPEFWQIATRARGAAAVQALRDHMAAIEHFYILDRIPSKEARRVYLQKVEAKSGKYRRQELEQKIIALFNSRKELQSE